MKTTHATTLPLVLACLSPAMAATMTGEDLAFPPTALATVSTAPAGAEKRDPAAPAPAHGPEYEPSQGGAYGWIDTMAPAPPGMEILSIGPVFFAFDKATLDNRARRLLDRTAHHVRHHNMDSPLSSSGPGLVSSASLTTPIITRIITRIIIRGHADEVGSSAYNYRLADRRAAAVKDYLVQQGVSPALIHSTGLGEHFPIDESWTREGRRRNRQVEIYIIQYSRP